MHEISRIWLRLAHAAQLAQSSDDLENAPIEGSPFSESLQLGGHIDSVKSSRQVANFGGLAGGMEQNHESLISATIHCGILEKVEFSICA
jgi:hypothetical protein